MRIAPSPLLLTSLSLVGLNLPVSAGADVKAVPSIAVTASGGYGSNPFLVARDDAGAATVSVDVTPSVELIDGSNQAVISGNYNRTEYISKYDGNDGYGLTLNGFSQLSERMTLNIDASYSSAILGAQNSLYTSPGLVATPGGIGSGSGTPSTAGTTTGGVTTDPVAGLINGDIGLIGLRQRRNLLSADASVGYQPDARSTWTFGVTGSRATYPDSRFFASNYRNYGANAAYTRQLNETTTVGLSLSGSVVDYSAQQDSRIYTPRLTFTKRLSSNWSLNAAAGAGIVDNGGGTSVTASVDATLCKAGNRNQACISVSRNPSVTGFGGVRTQSAVSGTYTYQLTRSTDVSASASYTHIDGGNIGGVSPDPFAGRDQDYLSVDLSVRRQIQRQLSIFGGASYRDVSGLGASVAADVGGRIGVSVAMGGRR